MLSFNHGCLCNEMSVVQLHIANLIACVEEQEGVCWTGWLANQLATSLS